MTDVEKTPTANFIRNMIANDLQENKNDGRVHTRFPPEPNGYLHIGHAKSICLNFGIADENEGGVCNLRFDDSNPEKESLEYVEAIKEDVRWLGFDWEDRLHFTSDYFDQLYEMAVRLIEMDLAFVDEAKPPRVHPDLGQDLALRREVGRRKADLRPAARA